MDIGSGKGYLSQYLALHCGLTVVGVDAQEINTLGAETRNRKVLYNCSTYLHVYYAYWLEYSGPGR